MMKLIDRFKNSETLLKALLKQEIVEQDREIATCIADKGSLVEFAKGETILEQGSYDQDVYFILAGEILLSVNGNEFPYRRGDGISIGEMSALDPTQPRSATAIANIDTVALKLNAESFNEIANRFPEINRRLSIDLSQRLNQRNQLVSKRNDIPRVFIISSVESIDIARKIAVEFDHDNIEMIIWNDQGIFKSGNYTLEDLQEAVENSDFGLAILHPDDVLRSREEEHLVARDNVIFELGLFMGVLTRTRTYLAIPRDEKLKLASDLVGLNPLEYIVKGEEFDVRTLAIKLRELIKMYGIRNRIK